MRPTPPTQLNQILFLLDSGRHSHREIALIVGVHHATVSRIQLRDRPLLPKLVGGGQPKLTERDIRHGKRLITSGKIFGSTQLAKELSKINNKPVSARTVRRQLRKAGMQAVGVKKKKGTT